MAFVVREDGRPPPRLLLRRGGELDPARTQLFVRLVDVFGIEQHIVQRALHVVGPLRCRFVDHEACATSGWPYFDPATLAIRQVGDEGATHLRRPEVERTILVIDVDRNLADAEAHNILPISTSDISDLDITTLMLGCQAWAQT